MLVPNGSETHGEPVVLDGEPIEGDGASGPAELIPRATIEGIVARRNVALARFDEAHAAITSAGDAIRAAQQAAKAAAPNQVSSYTYESDSRRQGFLYKVEVADADQFRKTARCLTDIAVWSYVIEMTALESVMDKEEKDKLRAELNETPPEITVDNIYATLRRFAEDADTIWRRGLANCFSKLDRRFRSHTGWKIGSRIIIDGAFSDTGHWSYYSNHCDTLLDVERAFYILDELTPPPHYYGILQAIERERADGWGARQSEIETEFFKVRIFKNGNCHLWFRRDDLVEKANRILAEYYGEALADGTDEGDDSGLSTPKTAVAKYFGHFPTPPKVAKQVIETASIYAREDVSGRLKDELQTLEVLEPSAGAGNLARLAASKVAIVDCVEIQPHLARQLEGCELYRNVWQGDFLKRSPGRLYDRVVMNPPFDRERDIDHVMHAMRFLKPGGCLVAIMSAGTEWRETKKARAFRDRMETLDAEWRDLPAGSFSEVGTNVNTVIVRVWKDGRKQWSF